MAGPASVVLLARLVPLLLAAASAAAAPSPDSGRSDIQSRLNEAARAVAAWTPCMGVSPWELSDLEDTDIMDLGDERMVYKDRKWPNKTIPYFVEKTDFTQEQVSDIYGAIEGVNKVSCVKFREATNSTKDFVRIRGKQQGCHTEYWGRKGGEQYVNLQPDHCLHRGTIYHELFHVIGFVHEHNSPKRDDFIRIIWENVEKGRNISFTKYRKGAYEDFGLRYDYDSISHFSRRAYSKNGRDTIETHDPFANIGLKKKPSYIDIAKIKFLYEC